MLQALIGAGDVATLTESPWSAAATNNFYGTSLPDHGVTQHLVPMPWRALSDVNENSLTRLRMSALLRRARALAPRYDLMITADNYAPFATRGIQYVHFPANLQPPPARLEALVHPYFAICNAVLGLPWHEAARNVTLANSHWTAEGIERLGS